jgi:hypothetical protein
MAQQLTGLKFESGLILPGSRRLIEAPLTPQSGSEQLIVQYATVGTPNSWKKEVLLRRPAGRDPMSDQYTVVAPQRMPAQSEVEPDALVTSTMKADSPARSFLKARLSVNIPASSDAAKLTGGITAQEARRRSGLPQPAGLRCAYAKDLQAWFLTDRAGEAVALRRTGERWVRVPMPAMEPVVPERFGKDTYMLLRPAAFGDLITVNRPHVRMYYDAGVTHITGSQIWKILKRARDRRIRLKLVTYDPNGLGVESAISAGVAVDSGGKWIDPAAIPSVRN